MKFFDPTSAQSFYPLKKNASELLKDIVPRDIRFSCYFNLQNVLEKNDGIFLLSTSLSLNRGKNIETTAVVGGAGMGLYPLEA